MDILYYVGGGSYHGNRELLYSLRSIEKHCKDVDRVWVVGNRPHFLKDVEYLWVEDKGEWYQNAIAKTVAAIEAGISKQFLLMNDDFYMMADFTCEGYPAYHRGDIPEQPQNEYQKIVCNTRKLLEEKGLPFKHYGVHCPIVIDADKYMSLKEYFGKPYSIRCLYGNHFCDGVRVKDTKYGDIRESETKCFSSLPWCHDVLEELKGMFPEPSRWEGSDV